VQAIQQISASAQDTAKFCFFIDGLDEYDGDVEEIIDLLQNLSSSPSIKICLSSRPWNEFRHAFDETKWKLSLEDLTKKDITAYVHDELKRCPRSASFNDWERTNIEHQIISEAQGVWLWVYLVVRDILSYSTSEDIDSYFLRQVDAFDPDLEHFYGRIFAKIDRIHGQIRARIILLALESRLPLQIFTLPDLEDEMYNPEYAFGMAASPVSFEEAAKLSEKWKYLLHNRCNDLLEINEMAGNRQLEGNIPLLKYQVNFLHRAVRNFIQEHHLPQLKKAAGQFDPNVSLCHVLLACAKRLDLTNLDNVRWWEVITGEIMIRAKRAEPNQHIMFTKILDELRDSSAFPRFRSWWARNLIIIAVICGFDFYVKSWLDKAKILETTYDGRPLLDFALSSAHPAALPFTGDAKYPEPSATSTRDMVYLLLSHGANPNECISEYKETPWSSFLLSCFRERRNVPDSTKKVWAELISMLLNYGADVDVRIMIKQDEIAKRITAPELFHLTFPKETAVKLESLMHGGTLHVASKQGKDEVQRGQSVTSMLGSFWRS